MAKIKPKAAEPQSTNWLAIVLLVAACGGWLYYRGVIGGGILGPSPVTEPGCHVLIVEETEDRGTIKPGQLEAIMSTADGSVRDYCAKHCVAVKGNPDFALFDKDDKPDPAKISPGIAQCWANVPHPSTPWIVISDGKRTISGALPDTAEATLVLLKKLGGK